MLAVLSEIVDPVERDRVALQMLAATRDPWFRANVCEVPLGCDVYAELLSDRDPQVRGQAAASMFDRRDELGASASDVLLGWLASEGDIVALEQPAALVHMALGAAVDDATNNDTTHDDATHGDAASIAASPGVSTHGDSGGAPFSELELRVAVGLVDALCRFTADDAHHAGSASSSVTMAVTHIAHLIADWDLDAAARAADAVWAFTAEAVPAGTSAGQSDPTIAYWASMLFHEVAAADLGWLRRRAAAIGDTPVGSRAEAERHWCAAATVACSQRLDSPADAADLTVEMFETLVVAPLTAASPDQIGDAVAAAHNTLMTLLIGCALSDPAPLAAAHTEMMDVVRRRGGHMMKFTDSLDAIRGRETMWELACDPALVAGLDADVLPGLRWSLPGVPAEVLVELWQHPGVSLSMFGMDIDDSARRAIRACVDLEGRVRIVKHHPEAVSALDEPERSDTILAVMWEAVAGAEGLRSVSDAVAHIDPVRVREMPAAALGDFSWYQPVRAAVSELALRLSPAQLEVLFAVDVGVELTVAELFETIPSAVTAQSA